MSGNCFLDSVIQWVIGKGKRYSVIGLVSVNWQKGIVLFEVVDFFQGCVHIKSLFLRACFCLRKRSFVCVFLFRLTFPLDPIKQVAFYFFHFIFHFKNVYPGIQFS